MCKHRSLLFAGMLLLFSTIAAAQQPAAPPQEPPVYTYVASWGVPRQQWDAFTAYAQQNTRPVLERLAANGAIISWGIFSTYVHEIDGETHGVWWSAPTLAGIERARAELISRPPSPAITAAKHRDYLFRSLVHRSRTTQPTAGVLLVSESLVLPGKGQDWRQLWEKYNRPVLDQLFANGTLTSYELEVEQVHTTDPGMRFVVYTAPSMDAVDKVNAAIAAAGSSRTPEEQRTIGQSFLALIDGKAHRDYMASVSAYMYK